MILNTSYRDDIMDIIRQEPEKTFQDIGTTKKAVLSDTDMLDKMWPLYQRSVEKYDEDPWLAMTQALLEVWPTRPAYDQPRDEFMRPNEVWACGFGLNAKGRPSIDLKPTLGVKCSSQWLDLDQALAENPLFTKRYFKPYNKSRTDLTAKKYNLASVRTFKNKAACYAAYNELVQQEIKACKDVLDALYAKVIPQTTIARECLCMQGKDGDET